MASKKSRSRNNSSEQVSNGALVLMQDVKPALQLNASLLPDGTYRNTQGDAGKCTRCNRGIANKAVFVKHGGHVYGPECVAYVKQVEGHVPDADLVAVVQQQYRLRMGALTKAGMQRKGIIKPQDRQMTLSFADAEA
jgi:hypothetical protein